MDCATKALYVDTSEILVAVLVPLLSFGATLLVNRQSAKATKDNNKTAVATTSITSKTAEETEAYNRAKAFYTDIIDRQDREIIEFRTEVGLLKDRIEELERQVKTNG